MFIDDTLSDKPGNSGNESESDCVQDLPSPPPNPCKNGAECESGESPIIDMHKRCTRSREQPLPDENPDSSPFPPSPTPLMLISEIAKLFRDRIRDENMQNSYRMILFHLSQRGGRTQLELANITHLKPPTISVTLQKMESDGYVRRVPNERDMRQTLVFLTEKGEEYNRNMRKKIDIIDKQVASGFTEQELETIVAMLTRVRDNLRLSDEHLYQPME